MDIAAASLDMQRAMMGSDATMMMLKQAVVDQQAVLQIVQTAQENAPPPADPNRGQVLNIAV